MNYPVNKKRPINLDLSTLKFPAMAIASILHRVSGIVLFLLLPFMLCLLKTSLVSETSFIDLHNIMMTSLLIKITLWAFSAALVYHLLAGIRHLLMDAGFGEHLEQGRRSAVFVIISAIILTIFLGIWIW